MSIDGHEVGTFDEVKRIIGSSPAKLLKLTVFRDNRHVDVEVTTEETVERREIDVKQRELDITQRYGTIGIQPSAPAAVIGVPNPDSPAYRAGLRTFDVITNVGGMPVRRFMDLTSALSENAGETLPVTYLRPVGVPDALGGLADMAVFESGVVALTPDPSGSTLFERAGIELADLYLSIVPQDSYLYRAGLRPGDKILRLNDEEVPAWSTFCERVLSAPDKSHRLDFQAARDGRVRSGTFQIRREDFVDEHGQAFFRYVIPMQHWIPLAADERVEHPAPVRYALEKAIEETVNVTRFTLVGIVRLLQGRLSWKSLSGPIAIFEVAGEEGRKGADYFIWVMALLSINLGLLNLLPIPVLDGGHFMFFAIEGVLRKPLPLRTREIAHIIGMAILFCLMAMAFKNDVEKRWDVIRGQIGGISG
jgi:regulator of sigma E protease